MQTDRKTGVQTDKQTNLEFDSKVDVSAHVLLSVAVNDNVKKPGQRRNACQERNEHHPKPQEQVDLLVEQVDWQDALQRVAMHCTKATNLTNAPATVFFTRGAYKALISGPTLVATVDCCVF